MTREYTDAERMDWLQDNCCLAMMKRRPASVTVGTSEREFIAEDLRSAIDRALTFEADPSRFRDQPDDDGASLL